MKEPSSSIKEGVLSPDLPIGSVNVFHSFFPSFLLSFILL